MKNGRIWKEPRPGLKGGPSPRKLMSTWKTGCKEASKAGEYANHRLSRLLHEGKRELVPYGEWTAIWETDDRLFAVRKADKLALVGEFVTSLLPLDRAELRLPAALNTLYALAHLQASGLLLKLIESGAVHRKLKRKAAEALVQKHNPQFKVKPEPFSVRRMTARIARQLRLIKSQAPPAESAWVMRTLQRAMEHPFR